METYFPQIYYNGNTEHKKPKKPQKTKQQQNPHTGTKTPENEALY